VRDGSDRDDPAAVGQATGLVVSTGTAGVVLLVGAGLFVAAACAPSSYVFGMKDPAQQREFLARHALSWRWGQIPFAAGAVVSAIGLVVLGIQLDGGAGAAITAAGVVATVVSLPWAEHCRQRARSWNDFLDGRLPGWPFQVFASGTLAALGAVGLALLGTELPAWSAWLTIGATAVFTAAWLRFKDLPPFVLYLVTGALGVASL
jgi:hypothetical protein